MHVLNYTNPGAFKGWIREYYPIGEQRVSMAIPGGRGVSRVELLRGREGRAVQDRRMGGSSSRFPAFSITKLRPCMRAREKQRFVTEAH